ncbi:hypothetical protein NEIPOLOT_01988 [Neisseria polysaccharea ATCC 43768]|nr:hypothetical protein NEIPOLOT_01988 [Neisseria polysaccharea ATCC 43768]
MDTVGVIPCQKLRCRLKQFQTAFLFLGAFFIPACFSHAAACRVQAVG